MIPDDLVLALSGDKYKAVKLTAACQAEGRREVVAVLATSSDPDIRYVITSLNKQHQLERPVQKALAEDDSREVRALIAESTRYRALYEVLLADPDPEVRGHCG